MSSGFSIGGLISGLDSNTLISQLMQLERQPILRIEDRISTLETQQTDLRSLRTQLQTLRSRVQDFRLTSVFGQFRSSSSSEVVLTSEVSGENPVAGAYTINVTQLASATVATSGSRLGANVNPAASLASSGINTDVTAGTFSINGVAFTVDPATQSLNDILGQINGSAAGVTASYDALTDRVSLTNTVAGNTSLINLGGSDDDSNFLSAINATGATQSTSGTGSTTLTGTRNLGAVNPGEALGTVSFAGGAVNAGNFYVNGVSIVVDPTQDSLSDILARINESDAQVTASYDSTTDSIRVVSKALGSRTVNFTVGTSNFLAVTNLTTATQTAGQDAQFTLNGGAVQTRNTNEVADAIGGVTLNFLSTGTSTVTVSVDDDAIVEDVQAFITEFNASITQIRDLTGAEGTLRSDGTLTGIENFLRSTIFAQIAGVAGDYQSLLDIGISTGDSFDATAVSQLELDEDAFREALRTDRSNIENLFSNTDGTGIADKLFAYLDEATKTTGFLSQRAKANGSIDQQIQNYNDRIDQMELRLEQKEERLRKQFSRMEQIVSNLQSQSSSLSSMRSYL